MKISFLPQTGLGKWSLKLIAAFFGLFILAQFIVAAGNSRGALDDSFNIYQILIMATMIPAGICGIAAFITGIISIIRHKERAVLIILATAIGFLILFFVLGELISPH